MNPTENPYTQLLLSDFPRYFGRRVLISAIHQGVRAQLPRSFSISGVKTIGKTSLARYLCNLQGETDQFTEYLPVSQKYMELKNIIFIYQDCYLLEVNKIINQLSRNLQQNPLLEVLYPKKLVENPSGSESSKENIEKISEFLKDNETRLVFVFDHFDLAYESLSSEDETFLRSLAEHHSLFLLTEKKLSALFKDRSPLLNLQNILIQRTLGMLTVQEARQFILEPLPPDIKFSDREISLLLEATGGHTALLNLACEYLYNLRLDYSDLGSLLESPDIESRLLVRLAGLPAVKDLLGLLWTHLEEAEQHALQLVAQQKPINSVNDEVLQNLVQYGLLIFKLDEQHYHVFCELFRLFIAAQKLVTSQRQLEDILPIINPHDRQMVDYFAVLLGEADHSTAGAKDARSINENPYTQLLVSAVPEGFYGRGAVLSAILHGISAQTPRSFSISGAMTTGKTSLARYLCHPEGALRQHPGELEAFGGEPGGKQLIPLYLDCYQKNGAEVQVELPARLRQEARLKALLPGAAPVTSTLEAAKEDLEHICLALEQGGARLVLVLDHFDHAYETFSYHDETFLRSLATRHALVLLTEKKLSSLFSDPERFSPLQNVLIKRPLGMLAEREALQFIQAPLDSASHVDRGAIETPFSSRESAFLLEAAGGHPYLLALACEHLYNLRQEYPNLETLLDNPEIKANILAQLSGLPAVQDTLRVIWTHLDDSARQALLLAVHNQPVTAPEEVLQELVQTGLLAYRLDEQRYRIFCELFRLFIAAQQPGEAQVRLAEMLPGLTPRDRQMLEYMTSRPGELVTFDELKLQVWGGEQTSKRALEAAVHRVRQALLSAGLSEALVQNERGKGYRYIPEA